MRHRGGNVRRFPASLGLLAIGLVLMIASGFSSPPFPARSDDDANADAVDLRPNLEHWDLTPRAQKARGTCSVFAVTGAIEFALAERQRRGTRLSVEYLNWASNRAIGKHEDGGFFSDLWKGFEQQGICPETDMPYEAKFEPNLRPSAPAQEHAAEIRDVGLRLHWVKPWDPTKGLSNSQFDEVKRTLRRGWPVCGGFLWPKRERWTERVLEMADRDEVRDGHSVLLVGYRDDAGQPGGGVFMVWNSGNGPRDAAMSYACVRRYMNDAVWIDSGAKPPSQ